MREIKFRGQRVDNGDWVYGYLHMAYTASSGFVEMGFYISEFKNESFIDHEIIGTQSEYTGLKDKNGKEIYEGDIVIAANGYKGEIKFGFWQYIYDNETIEGVGFNWDGGEPLAPCVEGKSYEVIGNIYENHELISKQLIK